MNNVVNNVAYLRTTREFPEDLRRLSVECNKSYLDTATAVNVRTIGLFPVNRPAITGNGFYLFQNQRQQSLRQVFTFTTTSNIPHPINFVRNPYVTAMYGQYTDGTNWYGLIAGSSTSITGQISFYLTPNSGSTPGNIVFVVDGAAPSLTKGIIVLEWLSNV